MTLQGKIGIIRDRSFGQVACTPLHQLELRAADGEDVWNAIGDDPQFLLTRTDGGALIGGWYLLSYAMRAIQAPTVMPSVYPNYGSGYSEDTHLHLEPFDRRGDSRKVLIRLDRDAVCLRFDPADEAGEFAMSNVSLRRVNKVRALTWMITRAWRGTSGAVPRLRLLASTARTTLRGGLAAVAEHLYQRTRFNVESYRHARGYKLWLEQFDRPDCAAAEKEIASWEIQPLISIVMPTYNSPLKWLRKCIESVRSQAYPHWELCIADDASPNADVRQELRRYQQLDKRIKVVFRGKNGHISAASNSALELATGQYVALLDHDDELHPLALYEVAKAIRVHPEWKLIYSDEDKISESGRRSDPNFKPDWNYDLFLSQNCVSHLGVYETTLMRQVGGFRQGYEGSQDHDLALRCVEHLKDEQIGHIPKVLYHWRTVRGSTARGASEKNYAVVAGRRAIADHLQRKDVKAEVGFTEVGSFYRVSYALPEPVPRISLIIPTRDKVELLRMSVGTILERTDYPDFEILVVDNQSSEDRTHAYFAELRALENVRILSYDAPFNYSAINNFAARHATGQIIGLINNDIEIIDGSWLMEMARHAWREGVGAVGAMLYYPDDTIQHAGVITGVHGVAGHVSVGKRRGEPGYIGRGLLVQNLSALTAACLLVRKAVFDEVGGLDEGLKVAFNDIDFCLRLQRAGYRNVWTPHAWAYHHESASRGKEDTPEKIARFMSEVTFMERRWGDRLCNDPAYNPNLTLTGYPFTLAFPPRMTPEKVQRGSSVVVP